MVEEVFVDTIVVLVSLLFIASLTAIVLKRVNFPFTVGLVLVGIGLGAVVHSFEFLAPMRQVRLSPDIILYVLLPTLIFEAAVNIDSRLLMKNLVPVLALAAPGLVLSTVIVGGALAFLTPLSLGAAMLFGALISATDPVAVITLFKEVGAPKRLTMLVDGESLFNDATAIVLFRIVMAMIVSGAALGAGTLLKGTGQFFFVFFGGLAMGALIGYVMIRIIAFAKKDPLIEVALSTVAAYLAFIVADHHLGVSGVMSALGAGIVLSWYGLIRFTPEVKQYLEQFWSYAAFVANSFIFLLLGLTEIQLFMDIGHIKGLVVHLFWAIVAVTVARMVVIYGLTPLIGKLPKTETINRRYQTVIFWGGLRGAVPLALAFSLTSDFEHRQLIVELTLGIVLFTLLVQGTTIRKLMKFLKLDQPTSFERILSLQTLFDAKERVIGQIKEIAGRERFKEEVARTFVERYSKECDEVRGDLLKSREAADEETLRRLLWTEAISVANRAYVSLFEEEIISEAVLREFNALTADEHDLARTGRPLTLEIDPLPIERRIETWWVAVVRRLFPNAPFLRYFRMKELEARYECVVAMIAAGDAVRKVMNRLAETQNAETKVVNDCVAFFEKRADHATERLDAMIKAYPGFLEDLERRTIRQLALRGELEAVGQLEDEGSVPEAFAAKLKDDIHSSLDELEMTRRRELRGV